MALGAVLAWPGAAEAQVGTVTVTRTILDTSGTSRYVIAWTSDASGDVNTNRFAVRPGRLVVIRVVPGTGAAQPTDLYDITLTDEDSIDTLAGQGANLSNTTGTYISWDPPLEIDGADQLDLVVTNAGNANSGTVELLVR